MLSTEALQVESKNRYPSPFTFLNPGKAKVAVISHTNFSVILPPSTLIWVICPTPHNLDGTIYPADKLLAFLLGLLWDVRLFAFYGL